MNERLMVLVDFSIPFTLLHPPSFYLYHVNWSEEIGSWICFVHFSVAYNVDTRRERAQSRVASRCRCSDMQIIQATTAKSDWRRCECDFAVAESPSHVKEKQSFRWRTPDYLHSLICLTNWLLTDCGICLNVITPVAPDPIIPISIQIPRYIFIRRL